MILTEQQDTALISLNNRIAALEADRAIRNVLSRYMTLCDQPCTDTATPQLGDLFTADAVWEGIGELYTKTFGQQQGRDQIVAFLNAYLAPNPHFKKNIHYLTSDHIVVDGSTAHGQWIMLQISTYENDTSEAIGARLNIDFSQNAEGLWQMAHFRTQRLFSAPWNPDIDGMIRAAGVTA
jgi:hypothetical protein